MIALAARLTPNAPTALDEATTPSRDWHALARLGSEPIIVSGATLLSSATLVSSIWTRNPYQIPAFCRVTPYKLSLCNNESNKKKKVACPHERGGGGLCLLTVNGVVARGNTHFNLSQTERNGGLVITRGTTAAHTGHANGLLKTK